MYIVQNVELLVLRRTPKTTKRETNEGIFTSASGCFPEPVHHPGVDALQHKPSLQARVQTPGEGYANILDSLSFSHFGSEGKV